ncbi:MAG: response regulator [Candidatus Moranbacteria bacterium]|nr:response regulator [Candidatus Moranbacteria bacterium]
MEATENKKKVMLVEDDVFVSDIYQVKMHGEGLEVIVAMNGMEAIKHLEEGSIPDLILLDIVMPYMDGMEVLRRIKANEVWKNIPVMLLTNLSEKSQIEECMNLGANDYLIKSHFTPSEVMKKVYSLLKA